MVTPQDIGFVCFFSCFSRHLSRTCGCRCLGVVCGFHRLSVVFVCCRCGAAFICVKAIQIRKLYSISDKKLNK